MKKQLRYRDMTPEERTAFVLQVNEEWRKSITPERQAFCEKIFGNVWRQIEEASFGKKRKSGK